MTHMTRRRALVGVLALAPAAATTAMPVTIAADPDAELIALGKQFDEAREIENLTFATECSEEEADAAQGRTGDIADRIADTKANGLAGLRVKARALAWIQPAAIQDPESLYDSLVSSLIEDLSTG